MSSKVLTLAAVTAVAAAATVPALTAAHGQAGRGITVREKLRSVHFIHEKRATKGDRLATGDRVLTRQGLFDSHDKPMGTLFTNCTNVGRPAQVFAATLQCTASYRFADGQLVAIGVIRFGAPGGSAPLVGSGAYRGVTGEVTSAKPGKGYDVDVLHLDG
jgi:hypothetical protein